MKVVGPQTATSFLLSAFAGMLIFATEICASLVHLWTAVICYQAAGFWVAVLTFFTPFISEMFWFRRFWKSDGIFGTWYSVCLGVVLAMFGSWLILGFIISRIDDRAIARSA
jgi:hypothetical protein